MSYERIRQLQQERGELIEQWQKLRDKTDRTAEETAKLDEMIDKESALEKECQRLQQAIDAEARLDAETERKAQENGLSKTEQQAREEAYEEAFSLYLRGGMGALSAEQQRLMAGNRQDLPKQAQTVTTTGGGYLIPTTQSQVMEEAELAWGGVRQVATVFETEDGSPLTWPTDNDTSEAGELLGINTQATTPGDLAFGQVTFGAYMFSSKVVLVPFQLLQDSSFDLDEYVPRKCGTRIGRGTNNYFTTGTGSGQPQGIVTGSTLGKTGAAGQVDSIIYDDVIDLVHSVDPAYRMVPNDDPNHPMAAKFMFSDAVLKILKKLVDGLGRPLWTSGLLYKRPDTIDGYAYVINQSMATPAADAKSMIFGALYKHHIRDVSGVSVLRMTERYADYLQVGFLAYKRTESKLLDAGTHPIKHFVHPAA